MMPRWLARLDEWLVRNHPIVWRSRLHFVVALWVLGAGMAAAIGLGYPMRLETTPTYQQIVSLHDIIQIGVVALIPLWFYLVLRIPMPESPLRVRAKLVALTAAGLFTLLVLPKIAPVIAVIRVAELASDEEFAEEYTRNEAFGFWCCDERLTYGAIATNRSEINATLARYGLSTTGESDSLGECPLRECLEVFAGEQLSPWLLRDRMHSVHEAKAFRAGAGDYYQRFATTFDSLALQALLGGLLLVLLSHPVSAIRRDYFAEGVKNPRLRLPLRLPAWLERWNRALVMGRPHVWATQLHTFIYLTVTVGAIVVALGWSVVYAFGRDTLVVLVKSNLTDSAFSLLAIVLLGACWPLIWLWWQGPMPLTARTWGDNVRAVSRYFFAAAPLPVAVWLVGIQSEAWGDSIKDTGIVAIMMWTGVCFVVSWAFIGKYVAKRYAVFAAIASVALLGILFVDDEFGIGFFFLWMAEIAWVWLGSRSGAPKPATQFIAALGFASLPLLMISFGVIYYETSASSLLSYPLMVALSLPCYTVLAKPFTDAFTKLRYWPAGA